MSRPTPCRTMRTRPIDITFGVVIPSRPLPNNRFLSRHLVTREWHQPYLQPAVAQLTEQSL